MATQSTNRIQPLLSDAADRERSYVQWIAFLVTILIHLLVFLVVPKIIVPVQTNESGDTAKEEQVYEISLVEPEQQTYVEANPDVEVNEPDLTEQYSFRAQQAADESPKTNIGDQPRVEGDEQTNKIVQGLLEQTPPIEPSPAVPEAKPGEGEGTDGGKVGQPSETAVSQSQPIPAPDFIRQDPVSEVGPGSRIELTAEAPEVFEEPDPEAPLDVYRPQPSTESTAQAGDGSGGSVDAKPVPRARPRLAPELITGPLMKSDTSARKRGALAYDATFSEFGEYEQQFYAAIQTGWYQEIDFFQPIDTASRVLIQFTIYADGTVKDVRTLQSTASEVATFICETAITKRSPFRPWTEEMVRVFGQERTLTVTFHYR